MKQYEIELFPRKYGKYFTDILFIEKEVDASSIDLSYPYSKRRYEEPTEGYFKFVEDMRSVYADLEKAVYKAALKIVWMENRFGVNYINMRTSPSNHKLAAQLRSFLTKTCMVHKGMLFPTRAGVLSAIRKYAEDFYPGFYELLNPFKAEFEWPFEHVSLCYLLTVADMDEAIGLLQEADRRKLTYNEFLDFVANWVACYNEKYGEKYQLTAASHNSGVTAVVINVLDSGRKSTAQVLPESKDEEYD